ncbi:hypothetical protein [Clostridium luticellarii]|jgi:hypothetical protein|uniref:hypothetical protein n=1 Tax=Clostridium luticellarii TaxID=1691940 RepID=UPI002353CE5F|nr:hypothetical protein [Clostridium luticellarii]MCI1945586.1 hypothetical protein [Clostridium luticellarii]
MNKIDEKALDHQNIPFNCINELVEYCKDRFGTARGTAMFSTCINYGIMLGKRQERERYRKELEMTKVRNFKLMAIIHEIEGVVEDTFEILPSKSADKNLKDA